MWGFCYVSRDSWENQMKNQPSYPSWFIIWASIHFNNTVTNIVSAILQLPAKSTPSLLVVTLLISSLALHTCLTLFLLIAFLSTNLFKNVIEILVVNYFLFQIVFFYCPLWLFDLSSSTNRSVFIALVQVKWLKTEQGKSELTVFKRKAIIYFSLSYFYFSR